MPCTYYGTEASPTFVLFDTLTDTATASSTRTLRMPGMYQDSGGFPAREHLDTRPYTESNCSTPIFTPTSTIAGDIDSIVDSPSASHDSDPPKEQAHVLARHAEMAIDSNSTLQSSKEALDLASETLAGYSTAAAEKIKTMRSELVSAKETHIYESEKLAKERDALIATAAALVREKSDMTAKVKGLEEAQIVLSSERTQLSRRCEDLHHELNTHLTQTARLRAACLDFELAADNPIISPPTRAHPKDTSKKLEYSVISYLRKIMVLLLLAPYALCYIMVRPWGFWLPATMVGIGRRDVEDDERE